MDKCTNEGIDRNELEACLLVHLCPDVIQIILSYFHVSLRFIQEWKFSHGKQDKGNKGNKEEKKKECGTLTSPGLITALSQERVAITDYDNGSVSIFYRDGKLLSRWKFDDCREDDPDCEWHNCPEGLTMVSDNEIFITDGYSNLVYVFSLDGQLIKKWQGKEGKVILNERVNACVFYGIAKLSGDKVAIVDSGNSTIQIFTLEGKFVTKWEQNDQERKTKIAWSLSSLANIGNDILALIDWLHNRIWILNCVDNDNDNVDVNVDKFNYKCFCKWSIGDARYGSLPCPFDISEISKHHVAIVDYYDNRIQIWTKDGCFVCYYGTRGSGKGEFLRPRGIAQIGANLVAVTDTGNKRVQMFDLVLL